MTIENKVYGMKCDRCGTQLVGLAEDDREIWAFEKSDLRQACLSYSWREVPDDSGKWYCPRCYTYNYETDKCSVKGPQEK